MSRGDSSGGMEQVLEWQVESREFRGLKIIFFIGVGWCTFHSMRVKVRGSPWKLVLFFFDHMGLRGRTQAVKFGRSRYLLSHLPSSSFGGFKDT